MKNKILYWSPRILAILFIALLCLFSLDAFYGFNGWKSALGIIIHLTVPVIALLATIIAWKKDLVGTAVFLFFAIYYVYTAGLDRHWSWYVSIPGPALLIAILFFVNWLYNRKNK